MCVDNSANGGINEVGESLVGRAECHALPWLKKKRDFLHKGGENGSSSPHVQTKMLRLDKEVQQLTWRFSVGVLEYLIQTSVLKVEIWRKCGRVACIGLSIAGFGNLAGYHNAFVMLTTDKGPPGQ